MGMGGLGVVGYVMKARTQETDVLIFERSLVFVSLSTVDHLLCLEFSIWQFDTFICQLIHQFGFLTYLNLELKSPQFCRIYSEFSEALAAMPKAPGRIGVWGQANKHLFFHIQWWKIALVYWLVC